MVFVGCGVLFRLNWLVCLLSLGAGCTLGFDIWLLCGCYGVCRLWRLVCLVVFEFGLRIGGVLWFGVVFVNIWFAWVLFYLSGFASGFLGCVLFG